MTEQTAEELVAAIRAAASCGDSTLRATMRAQLNSIHAHATRLGTLLAERDAAASSEDVKMALGTMLAAFGDHEWTPAERGPVQQTALRVGRAVLAKEAPNG